MDSEGFEGMAGGRIGWRNAFRLGLSALLAWSAGLAAADVEIVLQDARKLPIAGVTCRQEGGPSGVSDASGRIRLTGVIAAGIDPGGAPASDRSLTHIPLSPGQLARVTLHDTRGRKVLDASLARDGVLPFTRRDKGLYLVTVTSPSGVVRGRLAHIGQGGAGLAFKGVAPREATPVAKRTGAAPDILLLCSKPGYAPQAYRVAEGGSLTVDFSTPRVIPLFDAATTLEPEVHYDRGDAIVTQWGDRARDRHAKEDQFQSYDHYLTWYWIHRTARFILTDKVAKGTNTIDVSWVTEWQLDNLPEFRAWYYGMGSVAHYSGNYAPLMKKEGPGTYDHLHNKISDAGHQWKYTYTIKTAIGLDGKELPLAVGQFMEIEASQFLDGSVPEGRDNYYGTTFLYEVGKGGLVPWYTVGTFEDKASERENSHKIPEKGWLGGRTTLPYMYTGEPDNHFMQMATNLSGLNAQPFVLGRRVLHTSFLDGVHDEPDNPVWEENKGKGGPRYINVTCNSCHTRNGRGRAMEPGKALYQTVVKVAGADGAPHPKLGATLQTQSVSGAAEGSFSLAAWTEADGLRKPSYSFGTGAVPERYSVRATPPLVGMGLLEAIPETALQGLEDPDDKDGDGISGRMNILPDPKTGEPRAGRFGWKAGKTSVAHQVAGALNHDMGVMTELIPKPDCGAEQADCGPAGAELADSSFKHLVAYMRLLGVRARRDLDDPVALRGEALFAGVGCASCHVPTHKTSAYHPNAELRNQTIHPYTDLLLHDMGPGLSDNLGEGLATGSEWRTPPLWGLGLQACVTGGVEGPFQKQTCTPHHTYLHDGRARSIEEAILWHGGEGEKSMERFKALPRGDKDALLKFLNSL